MPLNMTPCVFFGCIVYWIVGLNPHTFGYFLLILMLEALTAVSLGLAVSALMPSVEAANAAGPPAIIIGAYVVFVPSSPLLFETPSHDANHSPTHPTHPTPHPPRHPTALLFGGFFININSLPIVANWIPYLSFLKWTFQALCINEFSGATFDCTNGPPLACERTGEMVLARLSFGGDSVEYACFGLGMVLLGFTFSAIYILERSKINYMPLGHVGSKQKNK